MYGSPKDLNLPFPWLPLNHGKEEPVHQQKLQHEMNLSGLLRYQSSPNTLVGDVCDETAAEESMFARFMSPNLRGNMSGGGDGEKQPQQQQTTEAEAEVVAANSGFHSSSSPSPRMFFYSSLQRQQPNQHISSATPGVVEASCGSSSSPAAAGDFCHVNVPNGFSVVRNTTSGFGGGSSSDKATTNNSRRTSMGHQLNFSPIRGTTNLIPQIPEMDDGVRSYIPVPVAYPAPLWEDPTGILLSDGFSSGNRGRDTSEPLHGPSSLAQHYSLPKSAAAMSGMERNILQFQDLVPCKIRAKRGCATHPRSIAERVRRTRISERMRKLQQLVPNMDKQTNIAEMLDLAVDYIKELQMQTKMLSERQKKCSCSNQC